MMPFSRLEFSNIGKLKKGEIGLNNLTVLTGPNNSGKTYLAYIIYGLYSSIKSLELRSTNELLIKLEKEGILTLDLMEFIQDNLKEISNDISIHLKDNLPMIFNIDDESIFNRSSFNIFFDVDRIRDNINNLYKNEKNFETKIGYEEVVLRITPDGKKKFTKIVLFNNDLPTSLINNVISKYIVETMFGIVDNRIFILPSERAGLNLFYKELNSNRNALVENLIKFEKKKNINPFELILSMTSRYPLPISDYIKFLNYIDTNKKKASSFKEITKEINKKILNGKYKVKEEEIYFLPYRSNNLELSLHISSSTAKSLFGFNYYLENYAKVGDIIVIDEPELNLHPDNHRKLARIICRIVNKGIRVVLSTHSDHFIKELNNLIMLSENFPKRDELMRKYKYDINETLLKDKIAVYLVDNNTLEEIYINEFEGITRSTFDSAINEFNESNDEIYFAKQEGLNV